ncbi:hypothetical protein U1Q18_020854 [Sarracenia purpurea var. burkii]
MENKILDPNPASYPHTGRLLPEVLSCQIGRANGGQGGGGVAMVNVKVLPYRLGQCIEALDGKVDSQMEELIEFVLAHSSQFQHQDTMSRELCL